MEKEKEVEMAPENMQRGEAKTTMSPKIANIIYVHVHAYVCVCVSVFGLCHC